MSQFIAFLAGIFRELDFPAMVLVFMLLGIALAMLAAQRNPNFDWADGFKDDAGKVSWGRAAVAGAFCISSWCLIYALMNAIKTTFDADGIVKSLDALFPWFIAYMLVWAGTKSVDKLVDVAHTWVEGKTGRPVWTAEQRAAAKAAG